MKILVLNGSPKKDKSDTMHITRAFLDGMNTVFENDIHIIDTIDKNINYCSGCFNCMHNGGRCIYDDDMKSIIDELLVADLLILSFPLYAYGMPAQLKVIIDRVLPLTSMRMIKTDNERYVHTTQSDVSKLKFLMICGCGFPNSKQNFEPAILQFKLMFRGNNTVITVPESPMFNAPEASVVTLPKLEFVKEAGREYAKSGLINENLLAQISSPMIPEEVYVEIINAGV